MLECRRKQLRLGEAVQYHRAGEAREHLDGSGCGVAAVDDDRHAELRREVELSREEPTLIVRRSQTAMVVEARLADGDRPRVGKEVSKLAEPSGVGGSGTVRVDTERSDDLGVRLRDTERRPAGVDPAADGDDSRDARGRCPPDEDVRGLGARVEVRVRVGHTVGAAASMRGNSG